MYITLGILTSFVCISSAIAGTLDVKLENITTKSGKFFYVLFSDENGFPDDPKKSQYQGSFSAEASSLSLKGIPDGKYAFSIFHDKNDNGKLDTSFLGLPMEPFGFSNNPSIIFGPPSFDKAKIKVEGTQTIEVRLRTL